MGPRWAASPAEVFRKERRDGAVETRAERLLARWRGPRAGRTDYLSRVLLRPYAETLAAAGVAPEPAKGPPVYGACRSCGGPPWIAWRRYVKAIDLTLDGRAIPEVDDLCSLSLDLWAQEQGYERLEPSLAGV